METVHGGNLDTIQSIYNINRDEILDFSGNINPLGVPKSVETFLSQHIHLISTYPDENYRELKKSIGDYSNVPDEHILVGNGSTELISTFINIISSMEKISALLLAPCYSEYEREIKLNGGSVTLFPLEEKNDFNVDVNKLLSSLDEHMNLLVLCNPNNPTGTAIHKSELQQIVAHCAMHRIFVMVDETYVEFSESNDISAESLINEFENLFIIRGISKFFSAPGLRLGYAFCKNKHILTIFAEKKDPWSVNILAAKAGEIMFRDKMYIEQTKNLIKIQREKIYNTLLTIKGIKPYKTETNFILLKLLNDTISSNEIFEKMIQNKMLIRDAESFHFLDETFIRFCFLLPAQNDKLISLLKEIIHE